MIFWNVMLYSFVGRYLSLLVISITYNLPRNMCIYSWYTSVSLACQGKIFDRRLGETQRLSSNRPCYKLFLPVTWSLIITKGIIMYKLNVFLHFADFENRTVIRWGPVPIHWYLYNGWRDKWKGKPLNLLHGTQLETVWHLHPLFPSLWFLVHLSFPPPPPFLFFFF